MGSTSAMGSGASSGLIRSATFNGEATGFRRNRFVRAHAAKAHSGIWGKVHNGPRSQAVAQPEQSLRLQSCKNDESQAASLATGTVEGTTAAKVEQNQLPTLLHAPARSTGNEVAKEASPSLKVSSDDLDNFLRDRSLRPIDVPVQGNGEKTIPFYISQSEL